MRQKTFELRCAKHISTFETIDHNRRKRIYQVDLNYDLPASNRHMGVAAYWVCKVTKFSHVCLILKIHYIGNSAPYWLTNARLKCLFLRTIWNRMKG